MRKILLRKTNPHLAFILEMGEYEKNLVAQQMEDKNNDFIRGNKKYDVRIMHSHPYTHIQRGGCAPRD